MDHGPTFLPGRSEAFLVQVRPWAVGAYVRAFAATLCQEQRLSFRFAVWTSADPAGRFWKRRLRTQAVLLSLAEPGSERPDLLKKSEIERRMSEPTSPVPQFHLTACRNSPPQRPRPLPLRPRPQGESARTGVPVGKIGSLQVSVSLPQLLQQLIEIQSLGGSQMARPSGHHWISFGISFGWSSLEVTECTDPKGAFDSQSPLPASAPGARVDGSERLY